MEISRQRIRRDYAPLTVSVGVACVSANSPLTQVYNAALPEYEPDRSLTPTVIRPTITANASDGSWGHPASNEFLANMKWYVNGVDISTISAWSGQYEIDTVGSTRGSLTIYRNIAPGTEVILHFEAELVDDRLGVTIPIKTDPLVLSTFDQSEDTYSLSVADSNNVFYNPLRDKLHLYEHKVAQGLIQASSQAREAALDGNEYMCIIPIDFYKGGIKMTSGYTISLFRVNSATSFTELSTADDEVDAISISSITLDLRLISKADYLIKAYVDGQEVAQSQISVRRAYPRFTCNPTNATSILAHQTQRYDVAQVASEGNIVECPGSVIRMVWKTDSANAKGVLHNEGEKTIFSLAKTGIGTTANDDWLDVYIEAEHKETYTIATDENGDVYTDENGNDYIIN